MGRAVGVHSEFYRFPNDVVQTAKVAKVLLVMKKGFIGKYEGNSLDHINLNSEDDVGELLFNSHMTAHL